VVADLAREFVAQAALIALLVRFVDYTTLHAVGVSSAFVEDPTARDGEGVEVRVPL
jgi:hypothetical protein